jgi:hypothetical protein
MRLLWFTFATYALRCRTGSAVHRNSTEDMSQKPSFLHPSQRTLKTEQIGPSSHKNEYHVGVLEGNWCEDRNAFGRQALGPQPFKSRATTRDAFPPRSTSEYASALPGNLGGSTEAPRTLLFGHGEPVNTVVSTAESSFTGATSGLPPIAQPRRRLLDKKREEWHSRVPHDGRYVTTKNVTVDATAEHAKQNFDYAPVKSNSHGIFLKSLGSVMRQTNLRGED